MNNFKFKKSLLAIATGAALAAAGMTAANAESLLFPYWSTQNGVTSILSLSAGPTLGPGAGNATKGTGSQIHFVWNYSDAAGDKCVHFDNYGSLTPNDLIQQPVTQPSANWFGDKSTPAYFPSIQGGAYGFLVVSDNGGLAGGPVGPLGSLRGQMVIASAGNGTVAAVAGIPQNVTGMNEGDFSTAAYAPSVAVTSPTVLPTGATGTNIPAGYTTAGGLVGEYRLTWYPSNLVTTSWYGVVLGNMSGAIAAGTSWQGAVNYSNGGSVFGRDEDAYSGSADGVMTCSGILTPNSLMNSAQQSSVTNGGVARAFFTTGAVGAQKAVTGTLGTGVVLTKLESIAGPYTFVTPEKSVSGQGW